MLSLDPMQQTFVESLLCTTHSRCKNKRNIIHTFKEFSLPKDVQGNKYFRLQMIQCTQRTQKSNLLNSSISWAFRVGLPKAASSDLGFESTIGVSQVLLKNTSNTGNIYVLFCP